MAKHMMATKMPVTARALIQRINRKLEPDLERLRTTRGENMERAVGRYHVIDYRLNAVTHTNVDLEQFGRDLGVLADYEILDDGEQSQ